MFWKQRVELLFEPGRHKMHIYPAFWHRALHFRKSLRLWTYLFASQFPTINKQAHHTGRTNNTRRDVLRKICIPKVHFTVAQAKNDKRVLYCFSLKVIFNFKKFQKKSVSLDNHFCSARVCLSVTAIYEVLWESRTQNIWLGALDSMPSAWRSRHGGTTVSGVQYAQSLMSSNICHLND